MTHIEILRFFNKWRRGDAESGALDAAGITPQMIGQAIDACVADAERYQHLLENAVSSYSDERVPTLVCRFDLPLDGWRDEVSRRIDAAASREALNG